MTELKKFSDSEIEIINIYDDVIATSITESPSSSKIPEVEV